MSIRKKSVETRPSETNSPSCLDSSLTIQSSQIAPPYFIYFPMPLLNFPIQLNYSMVSSTYHLLPGQPSQIPLLQSQNLENNKNQKEAETILQPIQGNISTQQKYSHQQLGKITGSATQNQYRNVMPNLVRLVLNFSMLRQKSQKLLASTKFNLPVSQISDYYKYTKRIKTRYNIGNNSYISQKKLKEIFGISESQYFGNRSIRIRTPKQEFYKQIIRKLAYYYLNNLSVGSILSSKKIKKSLKNVHLTKRNRLISILKGQIVSQ